MTHSPADNRDDVDQLAMVVVSDEQASLLGKKLVAEGFRYTIITASSGLLPTGTSCLLLGIHSSRGSLLVSLVESVCKTRRTYIPAGGQLAGTIGMPPMMIEAEIGSASIYVLPVEYYEFF